MAMAPVQLFRTVTSRLDALSHEAPRTAETVVTQWPLSVQVPPLEHRPALVQVRPPPQTPHEPPQPFDPQTRPVQLGTHTVEHWPVVSLQLCPLGHVPHVPPQPLGPQTRPEQVVAQHVPADVQPSWAPVQVPQEPPQPSVPHTRPVQFGTHTQCPAALQVRPGTHSPHDPLHPSLPHARPVQSGRQHEVW